MRDGSGSLAEGADPPGAVPAAAGRERSGFDYGSLPCATRFSALVDPAAYVRLSDDWVLGLADVVTSTAAIEGGRYKAVNTAGAAVVSAVSNALGTLDFPFVFGGDGASFAVGPGDAEAASDALAATVSWVSRELSLRLRGATVAVGAIRAAGHDLRVARFAASPDVAYAMFSGGGRAWAEREMKAGRLTLPAAPPGARPDLTGLSCRFRDVEAANGLILSLIVKPAEAGEEGPYRAALEDVLALAASQPRQAHPLPPGGPNLRWPPEGFGLEARLQRKKAPLLLSQLAVGARTLLADLVFRSEVDVGGFSPKRYRRQMVENSDFRKFDDGLMMTLDCSPEVADRIAARLAAARAAGVLRFGLHRQRSALVTCIVPSATRPDHIHFVDGAAGGYAMAARDLKSAFP